MPMYKRGGRLSAINLFTPCSSEPGDFKSVSHPPRTSSRVITFGANVTLVGDAFPPSSLLTGRLLALATQVFFAGSVGEYLCLSMTFATDAVDLDMDRAQCSLLMSFMLLTTPATLQLKFQFLWDSEGLFTIPNDECF